MRESREKTSVVFHKEFHCAACGVSYCGCLYLDVFPPTHFQGWLLNKKIK